MEHDNNFHCPAINFQAAITFFIKLSLTFSIFMHMCTTWSPHLTHHHPAPAHSPGHPITSPWGCYVHSQNGWGGLCPSSLYWVPLHASCCSIIVKGMC